MHKKLETGVIVGYTVDSTQLNSSSCTADVHLDKRQPIISVDYN